MVIKVVSVQCNGWFLPEIILLTLCDYVGKLFLILCRVFVLALQSMFPPKPLDCSGLAAFRFFSQYRLDMRFFSKIRD